MSLLQSSLGEEMGEMCLTVVGHLLELTDQSRFVLRVPRLRDHVAEHPGMHFHFSPDVVIGLGGRTRLEFVDGKITLARHETAVIPAGIPHREIPIARAGEPFQNLIFSIYNETICAQLQRTEPDTQTLRVDRQYFDSSKDQILIRYLEELSEQYHGRHLQRHYAIKGLMMAYLSTLGGIISRSREAPPSERLKISQAKRCVQEYLGSPELSVKHLAGILHCSPDYLSHIFHRETGHRLIAYIHQERIKVAMNMLRNTALSISEVAYALGFESQAYFSRVFKRVAYKTPMDYRKFVEHSVIELEGQPRTIYAAS
ncbi:MAG: helix-turn-helix transcriptional regulator [Terrimicrobiaceae bacterium]